MQIGGYDIIIPSTLPPAEMLVSAMQCICARWDRAICEFDFSLGTLEVFVYFDIDSYRSWDNDGASPNNENQMIYLIAGSESLTAVVDDPKDEDFGVGKILESIKTQIQKSKPL